MCLTSYALAQTFETAVIFAVYAVGLYVDPKAAKKLLSSKQADISAVQGIPEQAVFDGTHTLASHLPPTILYRCARLACRIWTFPFTDSLLAAEFALPQPSSLGSLSRVLVLGFITSKQSETNIQPFWAKQDCVEEVKLSGT